MIPEVVELWGRESSLPLGGPDWLQEYLAEPIWKRWRQAYFRSHPGAQRYYDNDPQAFKKREAKLQRRKLVTRIKDAFRRHVFGVYGPCYYGYLEFIEVQRQLHTFPTYDELVGDPLREEPVTAWRMGELLLALPVRWRDVWVVKRPGRGLLALKHPGHALVMDGFGNISDWAPCDKAPTLGQYLYGETAHFPNPFDLRPENRREVVKRGRGRPMRCFACRRDTTEADSLIVDKKRICKGCLERFGRHGSAVALLR